VASQTSARFDAQPSYTVNGTIDVGWHPAVQALPDRPVLLAVDGPAVAHWEVVVDALSATWRQSRGPLRVLSTAQSFKSWPVIQRMTAPPALLEGDPNFNKLPTCDLADLFGELPRRDESGDDCLIWGPGAALAQHDVLWYIDLAKRFAEKAVGTRAGLNLGQPAGESPTTRRLFFTDWPLLDRHRNSLAPTLDRWVDVSVPDHPASLAGESLRQEFAALVRRPFRTRPTFNSTPWGGHWAQEVLGRGLELPNTALGYELIAPEAGVLLTDGATSLEVPLSLAVALHPTEVLGAEVHGIFGESFPIRFDYLDTVGGGNLSVHCHPQPDYMSHVFGWNYTQDETYYVVVGGARNRIFLGLRDDVDLDRFERDARAAAADGAAFDIGVYVGSYPADEHQLFLIPGGTPHGSGEGNVVLEVSATPYLYSLRFYDWLRRDDEGRQRPVHLEHAFANLERSRRGGEVRSQLIPKPLTLRSGDGWLEERLGTLDDMFFDVHRFTFDAAATVDERTSGRFHVLTVVEGTGVEILAPGHESALNCYETILVPAAVGAYQLRRAGDERVRVVEAHVR